MQEGAAHGAEMQEGAAHGAVMQEGAAHEEGMKMEMQMQAEGEHVDSHFLGAQERLEVVRKDGEKAFSQMLAAGLLDTGLVTEFQASRSSYKSAQEELLARQAEFVVLDACLLYTSPSPRDRS